MTVESTRNWLTISTLSNMDTKFIKKKYVRMKLSVIINKIFLLLPDIYSTHTHTRVKTRTFTRMKEKYVTYLQGIVNM